MVSTPTIRKRALFLICFAFVAVLAALVHRQLKMTSNDFVSSAKPNVADDMSRMNATAVHQIWNIPSNESDAQTTLRRLLEQARANRLHISIAGARHSMGGQTIVSDGIQINMLPLKSMMLDEQTDVLHIDTGAKWADVIPYLARHGRSIGVMQSDNNFTVGGSLSVNCHGWQYGRPPIASTVESIHLT